MFYVYGSDGYRRTRTLREQIIPAYIKKHSDAALAYFDGDEAEVADHLIEFYQNVSLFASVKLGVLFSPESLSKEGREAVKKLIDNEATSLVVVAQKKLPKKEFGFLYHKSVKSWEYETLKGAAWLSFIKQEAKARGANISDGQIRDLARAYEGDSFGVVTELEKLSLGGVLELKDEASDFFTLIKSLRYGRGFGQKFAALAELLEGGGGAPSFNMFARFTDGELRQQMARYDVLIKSGKMDYDEALFDVVIQQPS